MTQNNSMKTLIPEDVKELIGERDLNLKEKAPTRESLILELLEQILVAKQDEIYKQLTELGAEGTTPYLVSGCECYVKGALPVAYVDVLGNVYREPKTQAELLEMLAPASRMSDYLFGGNRSLDNLEPENLSNQEFIGIIKAVDGVTDKDIENQFSKRALKERVSD